MPPTNARPASIVSRLELVAEEGHALISRSAARRLASRLPPDGTVTLDFAGVRLLAPSFADELFRVWALDHPQVRLTPVNVTPAVGQMISRVLSSRGTGN